MYVNICNDYATWKWKFILFVIAFVAETGGEVRVKGFGLQHIIFFDVVVFCLQMIIVILEYIVSS